MLLGSRAARLAVLVTTVALILPLFGAATAAADPGKADPPGAERARTALARVQEMLTDPPGKARSSSHQQGPGSLTMAMRDLYASKDALRGKQRRTADRILARPTDGYPPDSGEQKYCVEGSCPPVETICDDVCVHYATEGTHAATSEYADAVLLAAQTSHEEYLAMGYRPPIKDDYVLKDENGDDLDRDDGGDGRPDIYLTNLGGTNYGYTAPEGWFPNWGTAAFGYIVLDNDYNEYCSSDCTATRADQLMQATTAHEYFHAVQFGYDFLEDRWFMEATATWAEDVVFDPNNDNVNYLYSGPNALKTPGAPIDAWWANPYGNWIWFRYLSERFGNDVVLKAWRRADAWRGYELTRTPKDKYSTKALFKAVKSVSGKGKKFWNKEFAKFADANQRPKRYYDEARANNYPKAPRAGRAVLTKSKRKKVRGTDLSRLASATYRVKPHKSLRKGWKLRVRVDGNTAKQGGFAIATIKRKGGGIKRVGFNLGRNGRKAKTLPFGKAKVRWIDVTIVSASTRNKCWLGEEYAANTCWGRSKDNNRSYRIVARAIR